MASSNRYDDFPSCMSVLDVADCRGDLAQDGVDGLEAVVVRHATTGRLSAVNASAFVSFDASSRSRCPRSRNVVFCRRAKDPLPN
jgi:hypothetical protein